MSESKAKKSKEQVASSEEEVELFEKVVHINRCAKVVKGGRRFSFAALVVVGDQNGNVGFGYGKAQMVPDAIRKGTDQAKKAMRFVSISGDTIPHPVVGNYDGGKVCSDLLDRELELLLEEEFVPFWKLLELRMYFPSHLALITNFLLFLPLCRDFAN